MKTKIYEIPGKLVVECDTTARAIIDTWTTYFVSLEEFREAVLIRGVEHAKANNVHAWIVDSHKAKGVFSPEIQDFIASKVFPVFAKIGIKYFDEQKPTSENGIVIMNPPYGERLKEEDINDLYKMMGDTLKTNFSGFDAWILSANKTAMKYVGLKTSKRLTLYNGALECKFHKYSLYSGSKKHKG